MGSGTGYVHVGVEDRGRKTDGGREDCVLMTGKLGFLGWRLHKVCRVEAAAAHLALSDDVGQVFAARAGQIEQRNRVFVQKDMHALNQSAN